jgi:APA family basic amino acid/polyamine antiporter
MTEDHTLERKLSLFDSTMINVGSMIGSGIFIVPAAIAGYLHSPRLVLLAWIAGGAISLCGALSVAELGAAMPATGGMYVYLTEAYGAFWGFLYGWAGFTVINSAAIAAVAVAGVTYLGFFIPLSALSIKLLAVLVILLLTAINSYGVEAGVWVQNILSMIKVGALAAIVALPFFAHEGIGRLMSTLFTSASGAETSGSFGLALLAVLWAYDGWIEITYVAGEVKNPSRNIPLSLLYSTLIVIALYVTVNAVYMAILSISVIEHTTLVASAAATAVIGGAGAAAVAIAVMISNVGAGNGFILTSPRIYYAMARDKLFFRSVARIHPKYHTPVGSLFFQGILSCVLALTGTFDQLINDAVFASWLFYALSCGAVILFRRQQSGAPRPYSTWGYPLTPILFIAFAVWLVVSSILEAPMDSATGVLILLTGVPVYYFWKRKEIA